MRQLMEVLLAVCALAACSSSSSKVSSEHATSSTSAGLVPSASPTLSTRPSIVVTTSPLTTVPTSTAATSSTHVARVRLVAVELGAEDPSPGGTFVILANVGSESAELTCWRVRTSATDPKGLVIASPSRLGAGQALRLTFGRGQINDPDHVALLDKGGAVIDASPTLHDTAADDQLFARTGGIWRLGRPNLPQPLIDGRFAEAGGSHC